MHVSITCSVLTPIEVFKNAARLKTDWNGRIISGSKLNLWVENGRLSLVKDPNKKASPLKICQIARDLLNSERIAFNDYQLLIHSVAIIVSFESPLYVASLRFLMESSFSKQRALEAIHELECEAWELSSYKAQIELEMTLRLHPIDILDRLRNYLIVYPKSMDEIENHQLFFQRAIESRFLSREEAENILGRTLSSPIPVENVLADFATIPGIKRVVSSDSSLDFEELL